MPVVPSIRSTLLVLALLVAAPVLAGCVGGPGPTPPPDVGTPAPRVFVDPIVDDHDHADFEAHNLSMDTMALVGWTPLGEEGKPYSYIGELDFHGDLVVVQILGRGSVPGFVLVDVADPTKPTVVGRAMMPDAYVVDVKFSPDGKYVFAASQRTAAPSEIGEKALATAGVAVWDVTDPKAPKFVSATPVPPLGCHMLSVKDYAGGRWVFCVGEAIEIYSWEANRLVPRSRYIPHGTAGVLGFVNGPDRTPFPHDMTFVIDPLDKRPTLYVSYWDLGLHVVDVSNPLAPLQLGGWGGEGAKRYEGNVHSAMPIVLNGTRFIVAAPELLGNTVPAVWILEAKDFRAIELSAEWIPPGEHGAQNLRLTTHQFQLVDGRMYMAYNHAGVWVLDLATILGGEYVGDPARPEVLGYYLPHQHVELFDAKRAAVPNTWDVAVRNGYIYASDRYTGFYVLHYKPDTLGDPALTSFA
ncbi:MAG TPA: hypothetical protein VM889_10495 [Candidatus Thermoplasmatota archaeon]|nr:hypothetical protein [Candidatus Thermoplasmatota archaeon]